MPKIYDETRASVREQRSKLYEADREKVAEIRAAEAPKVERNLGSNNPPAMPVDFVGPGDAIPVEPTPTPGAGADKAGDKAASSESEEVVGAENLTVPQIKKILTDAKIEFKASASKPELLALLPAQQA